MRFIGESSGIHLTKQKTILKSFIAAFTMSFHISAQENFEFRHDTENNSKGLVKEILQTQMQNFLLSLSPVEGNLLVQKLLNILRPFTLVFCQVVLMSGLFVHFQLFLSA